MVWPALDGERGTPDPGKTVGESAPPRVFETFKALHEVFHSDGTAPSAWNAFDLPHYNPCDRQEKFGEMTLGSFSKFSNLGQAAFGSLVGPLIGQNGTSVRFLTTYNNIEFAQIMDQTLYRRPTPPATFQVTFKNGAIDTKSAWMDLKDAKPRPKLSAYNTGPDVLPPGYMSSRVLPLVSRTSLTTNQIEMAAKAA